MIELGRWEDQGRDARVSLSGSERRSLEMGGDLEDEENMSRKELAILESTITNDDELFNVIIGLTEKLQIMVGEAQ